MDKSKTEEIVRMQLRLLDQRTSRQTKGKMIKRNHLLEILRQFMRESGDQYGILELGVFGARAAFGSSRGYCKIKKKNEFIFV